MSTLLDDTLTRKACIGRRGRRVTDAPLAHGSRGGNTAKTESEGSCERSCELFRREVGQLPREVEVLPLPRRAFAGKSIAFYLRHGGWFSAPGPSAGVDITNDMGGLPSANERDPDMKLTGQIERMNSMAIWAWVAIVEKEADKLSDGGRAALGCLREDLERMSIDDDALTALQTVGDRLQSGASRLGEYVERDANAPYEVAMACLEVRSDVERWTEIRKTSR